MARTRSSSYRPLPSRDSIRLLRFRGCVPGDSESAISEGIPSYGLEVHSIEAIKKTKLIYTALSYCWGEEPIGGKGRRTRVKCNDELVSVQVNLHDALMQFTHQVKQKEPFPHLLWADSLCTYPDRSSINYLRNLRFRQLLELLNRSVPFANLCLLVLSR